MQDALAVVIPVYNEELCIMDTLTSLKGQDNPPLRVRFYVVDNGSTDGTQGVIWNFLRNNPGFPLSLIEEPIKGTGTACNTGFSAAISGGAQVIVRTDGDTVVSENWLRVIVTQMSIDRSAQLITGRVLPRKDELYRPFDDFILPFSVRAARIALTIVHFDRNYLGAATGGNMAIRSDAFETIGGFKISNIDVGNEDVQLSIDVIRNFGREAVAYCKDMVCYTSMRRIRQSGLISSSLYYLFPGLRKAGKNDKR